jgi:hypothetical protein
VMRSCPTVSEIDGNTQEVALDIRRMHLSRHLDAPISSQG